MNPRESEFASEDVYHPNTSLVNHLRQEQTPEKSFDGSDVDSENNEEFLQELENENKMLERELENLVKMKNDSGRFNSDPSLPTKSDEYQQTQETANLDKIDEKTDEDRESYCYSASEEGGSTHKKLKRKKRVEGDTHHIDMGSEFTSPDIKIEDMKMNSSKGIPQQTSYSRILDFSTENSKKEQQSDFLGTFALKTSDIDEEEPQLPPPKKSHIVTTSTTRNSFNKENISNNESTYVTNQNNTSSLRNPSGMNQSQVSKSMMLSHSTKKIKNKSPPKYEKMDKLQSLEQRLLGANKAVKSLERELKLKDDKIQDLLKDIEKKNKIIENQKAMNSGASSKESSAEPTAKNTNNVRESLTTIMKKKEKQLEKKVKDQDVIIQENKKYMARLQELNQKLLSKIKEMEDENMGLKNNEEVMMRLTKLEKENIQLKDQVGNLKKDKSSLMSINDEQDTRHQRMIELYENVEDKSEKFIQKNKTLNDLLLNLITTYHNRDKLSSSSGAGGFDRSAHSSN